MIPKTAIGNENRSLLRLILFVGLCGIISYFLKSADVFPSASIDLKLSKKTVTSIADRWARQTGYDSGGSIKSTVFNYDDDAKTFLEYELKLSEASALMRNRIPIWYWSVRLCKPLHLDEFNTWISPSGKLVALSWSLPNDRAVQSIPHQQALILARGFVEGRAGYSLDGYRKIEDGSISQSHRTDHAFTWEDTRESFSGARLRTHVYISGNLVSEFNHYLYIPEKWNRKFSKLRSYNEALREVASIFYVTFNTATFFAFMWALASGFLRWRFSLWLALFMALLDLLDSLNSLPTSLHTYATTMSYHGYLTDVMVAALVSAATQFMYTLVLAGSAEALYRLVNPTKVALEKLFTALGLRTGQVLYGVVAGLGIFGIHLGWIVFYYLFGRQIGLWSPLEVQNVETLSAVVPFYSALYIGISASIFEELTYRVLGLTFFQRLVKSFWLANLLQAAAWAFMHSNYPQEPPWARGVELTAMGLLYGFVVRRWGLIACIVAHSTFDTFIGVTPLILSPVWSLRISALIGILPFPLLAMISYWQIRRKGFTDNQSALLNSAVAGGGPVTVAPDIFPTVSYQYRGLSGSVRIMLALLVILASAVQLGYFFPVVGGHMPLTMGRSEALEKARKYLSQNKIPTGGYLETSWLSRGLDAEELQYLYEKAKFERTAILAQSPGYPLAWAVRFFKPLNPEEYLVSLDQTGRVQSFSMTLPEDAPGMRLNESQAREMVEDYIHREHRECLPFVFDDSSLTRHKARNDYTFHFNLPAYKVGEADCKLAVAVTGNQVNGFDLGWRVPDHWRWKRAARTAKDQICHYVQILASLGLLLAAVWWVIGVLRSGAIHWRPAIIVGAGVTLLVIPRALNDLPEFFVGYSTDTPMLSYFTAQAVKQVTTAIYSLALGTGLTAFALASFRILSPRVSLPAIIKTGLSAKSSDERKAQRNFWLDAILVGYAFGIGARALSVVASALHSQFSPVVTLAPLESFCSLANVNNLVMDSLLDCLSFGLSTTLLVGVLAGMYAKFFTSRKKYFLFAIVFSLIYSAGERYWQDYVLGVAVSLIELGALWFIVCRLARWNILAYFMLGASATITGTIRILMAEAPVLYWQEMVVLEVALLSPMLYLLYLYLARDAKGNRQMPELDRSGDP